jgi:glc operon protein GlcG
VLEDLQMKLFLAMAITLAAHGASDVAYVDHDKVAAALAKGGPLVTTPDYVVSGSHRSGAGQIEIHEKETDVIYVVEGEATFVTGGTVLGRKATKAGQFTGSGLEGGETHHLSKGDVIVVPAGTPHWFKEVPQAISYYVVKVVK